MTINLQPIDHAKSANRHFLSQYKNAVLFQGFTESFVKELDALEEQCQLFQTITVLSQARGYNLTQLGKILGARQRPVSDDEMRVLLYALIGAYNSEGRPENIRALVIQTVQADSIVIEDVGGATFSFTIFNGSFTFGIDLLYDVVNLAKPVGVELLPFKLASYYNDATFSFVGDQRPKSEGYALAVARSVVSSFYDYYFFPAALAISTTDRYLKGYANNNKDYFIKIITDIPQGELWIAELATKYKKLNGSMGFNISTATVPNTWRFTCLIPPQSHEVEYVDNYIIHTFYIVKEDQEIAYAWLNDTKVQPGQIEASFPVYDEDDRNLWNLNNASGMGYQYTQTTFDPDNYSVIFGGRYAISIVDVPLVFGNTGAKIQNQLEPRV